MTAYDPAAVCPDEACTATVRHWHRSHGDRIVRCTHRTYCSDTCRSYPRCYEPRPRTPFEWVRTLPKPPKPVLWEQVVALIPASEGLPPSLKLTLGDETRVYVPVAPEPDPEMVEKLEAKFVRKLAHIYRKHGHEDGWGIRVVYEILLRERLWKFVLRMLSRAWTEGYRAAQRDDERVEL